MPPYKALLFDPETAPTWSSPSHVPSLYPSPPNYGPSFCPTAPYYELASAPGEGSSSSARPRTSQQQPRFGKLDFFRGLGQTQKTNHSVRGRSKQGPMVALTTQRPGNDDINDIMLILKLQILPNNQSIESMSSYQAASEELEFSSNPDENESTTPDQNNSPPDLARMGTPLDFMSYCTNMFSQSELTAGSVKPFQDLIVQYLKDRGLEAGEIETALRAHLAGLEKTVQSGSSKASASQEPIVNPGNPIAGAGFTAVNTPQAAASPSTPSTPAKAPRFTVSTNPTKEPRKYTGGTLPFNMLATENYLEAGDEIHVPISAFSLNGVRTPVAGVVAVMQYVGRTTPKKLQQTDWLISCPNFHININSRPMTGKGPTEFAAALTGMGLEGPKAVGWANKVNFVRRGQVLGTVQKVKDRELLQ